jgi:hypothetical protein
MNKSYEGKLKLNSQLNWKITTYTPGDFRCVMKNLLKRVNTNPCCLCNLNQIIYVNMYTVTVKKNK